MREIKTFEELEKPINLTVKTKCPEKKCQTKKKEQINISF
jgi:hypothetical protein